MKSHIKSLAGATLLAAGVFIASGCASEKSESELAAQAKITKAQAQEIALAKAPGGTVKEAEIEKEHGKIVWSFDIATPGTQDITEVAVDAMSGDVVSVDKESAAEEAKEQAKEGGKKQDKD